MRYTDIVHWCFLPVVTLSRVPWKLLNIGWSLDMIYDLQNSIKIWFSFNSEAIRIIKHKYDWADLWSSIIQLKLILFSRMTKVRWMKLMSPSSVKYTVTCYNAMPQSQLFIFKHKTCIFNLQKYIRPKNYFAKSLALHTQNHRSTTYLLHTP